MTSKSYTSRHLTHERLCDLLLASDVWDALDSGTETGSERHCVSQEQAALHLRQCASCRSEYEALHRAAAGFHAAAHTLASRYDPAMPAWRSDASRPPFQWWRALADSLSGAPLRCTAAALGLALLVTGAAEIHRPHAVKAPAVAHGGAVAGHLPRPRSASPESISDDALLDSIDQQIATPVPTSMEPLATPNLSNESANQQRKN
jgi:hypothetical protein